MSPARPTLTVVGRRPEPAHFALREFLTRIAQPFTWLEAESQEAAAALSTVGAERLQLPVVIDGDQVLEGVTARGLLEAWGLDRPPARAEYDLVIVGAGPAGLAAAVYAASDGLSTLVLERDVPGGQASHTSLIENFFGFPDGIGGAELARLAGRQAEGFDAELMLMRGAAGSSCGPDGRYRVVVEGGHEVGALAVIAAPGMVWRRLELDGIDDLIGRGVYYGAGRSEAAHCGGDDVVVVGAGNSAGQAAMSLADAAARVTMVVRGDRLGRTMSEYLVRRIEAHPLIDVRFHTQVSAVHDAGDNLAEVTLSGPDGREERRSARALFLCIGGRPRTGWAAGVGVQTDDGGYILTGPDLLDAGARPPGWPLPRDPLALETSRPGLFAAGDVRHGSTKRVAGAVGEGAMAVALTHRRLAELAESRGGMRTRRLGAEGPTVSVVGLGCNNFGWRIDAAGSRAVVDAALDEGITLFDTADTYGETASETMLGEALAGRRDRVVLATKFGYPVPDAPELPCGSRDYIRWAIDGSLRRLRTSVIDVYFYHRPDGETPPAETFAALAELVREGKIRAVGVSNHDVAQVRAAAAAAREHGAPLVAVENRYSVVRRDAERELLPTCEELGLGMLPYYPLEGGTLTGKYRRGAAPPAQSRFAAEGTPWRAEQWLNDEAFDRVEALEDYAAARGRSLLDVAIGGLAAMPAVASVIAGATRPEQVRANVRACEWEPTPADLAELP